MDLNVFSHRDIFLEVSAASFEKSSRIGLSCDCLGCKLTRASQRQRCSSENAEVMGAGFFFHSEVRGDGVSVPQHGAPVERSRDVES